MVQIRASQVFTHSIEDAVAAKKALDADEPFNEVVRKYSTCPSKQQEGDLGWMPEEAALSLMGEKITKDETNKIIGPVHSEYGYHILLITEVKVENQDSQTVDLTVITPEALHTRLSAGGSNLILLDLRESWEWDIAHIEGSQLITRENSESILSNLKKDGELILIDWKQDRSPSFVKWLLQQGFSYAKCLEGGIDAWSDKIDPSLARYEIDEDDGYRYEDIIDEGSEQNDTHQHDH
jgi:adenylyltransferase/sulfurtransferase